MSHIVHVGLDESGSLSAATAWFAMAVVATAHLEEINNLIVRVALRSGKRLKRERSHIQNSNGTMPASAFVETSSHSLLMQM